jgi:hypothetical protein
VRELQKKGGMAKFLADHQREMLADAMTGLVTFCLVSKSSPPTDWRRKTPPGRSTPVRA